MIPRDLRHRVHHFTVEAAPDRFSIQRIPKSGKGCDPTMNECDLLPIIVDIVMSFFPKGECTDSISVHGIVSVFSFRWR